MTNQEFTFPRLDPPQLSELTVVLGEIDEFKGRWRRLGEIRAERLASLRQVTTIESAGSSTRIEGARLSNDEVERVLKGLRVDSFRSRDEEEVRGYAELLQIIFDDPSAILLTENYIKQLHKILLGHSRKDAWHRGEYKKNDNHVEAKHADGTVEIVFRTASPFDTPRLMSALVEETTTALRDATAHPLIVIARFLVVFLAIHPFQDGNGRLSRALTALLMLHAGYAYVPYASIERVIEDNKVEYYNALRTSQVQIIDAPSDFGPWLMFFLRVLRTQKRSLEAKLDIERSILQISDVQQSIMELIDSRGRGTTPEIARVLNLPLRSTRYHLATLVARGLIEAHGERKGRYYTKLTTPPTEATSGPESRNGAILAAILERGGTVTRSQLKAIIKEYGSDGRLAGALHGRRLAHLRRDPKTGQSVLTSRGREVAEQYLFARRLSNKK